MAIRQPVSDSWIDRSSQWHIFVGHTRMHFSRSEPIRIDRRKLVLRVNDADGLLNAIFSTSLQAVTSHSGRELLYSSTRGYRVDVWSGSNPKRAPGY